MSKAWRESTSVDSQAEFQLHWLHCVCSCGMCMRVQMCAWTHTETGRRSSLDHSSPHVLRQGFSLNLEFINSTRLASQ